MQIGLFSGLLFWLVLVLVAGWQVALTVWLWVMGLALVIGGLMFGTVLFVLRRRYVAVK